MGDFLRRSFSVFSKIPTSDSQKPIVKVMKLGILAPAPVANALRAAGLPVVTSEKLIDAAKLIRDEMKTTPNTPVLIVSAPDGSFPVKQPVIEAFKSRTKPVLVEGEDFTFPVAMGELAGMLGLSVTSDDEHRMLSFDGVVEDTVDDDDDWLDESLFDDEPVSEQQPTTQASAPPAPQQSAPSWDDEPLSPSGPVAPASAPAVPVEPVAQEPSWEEPPVQTPVQEVAAPQPPVPPSSWGGSQQPPQQQQPQQHNPHQGQQPQPRTSWSMSEESGMSIDSDDLIGRRGEFVGGRQLRTEKGRVLFTWGGGGGVGKSSYSRHIAQAAGEAGMDVLLMDGNRGQADLSQYVLRNTRVDFPTIHMYARTGDIQSAIMPRDEINRVRGQNVAPVSFDTIFSPTPETHDLKLHTPSLYWDAVEDLRSSYDLIVIDTQTLDQDSSDLWDKFILPMMVEHAWALGISNMDPPKMKNLIQLSSHFYDNVGVNPARSLTVVTLPDPQPEDHDTFQARLGRQSTFMGITPYDETYKTEMSTGYRIPTDNKEVGPVLRSVLRKMTGLSAFDPVIEEPEPAGKGILGLFSRKKKGR